ncbi:hypothetical protein IW262DRAFT_183983 [Armillaria fumosa]|nr:hypothetical protein IW262DRAFT_183983 [Armillaria fumosa]
MSFSPSDFLSLSLRLSKGPSPGAPIYILLPSGFMSPHRTVSVPTFAPMYVSTTRVWGTTSHPSPPTSRPALLSLAHSRREGVRFVFPTVHFDRHAYIYILSLCSTLRKGACFFTSPSGLRVGRPFALLYVFFVFWSSTLSYTYSCLVWSGLVFGFVS